MILLQWLVALAALWIGLGGVFSAWCLLADERDGYLSRAEMWRRMVPCSLNIAVGAGLLGLGSLL